MEASYRAVLLIALLGLSGIAAAEDARPPALNQVTFDRQVQQLLDDTLDLDRDLRLAEEELVPVRRRFEVVVRVNAGDQFRLSSVTLTLDDKPLTKHVYSPIEVAALRRGHVQRLYLGSVTQGTHRLEVQYVGRGDPARAGSSELEFTADTAAQLIEIAVNERPIAEGEQTGAAPAIGLSLSNWILPP